MTTSADKSLSLLIKEKAYDLGFDLCGMAASRSLKERENVLIDWCTSGMNGGMSYLAKDVEKRINPEYLVPGAKSLIVTGLNYYTDKQQLEDGVPVLSRYAYGANYHDVIISKLDKLLAFIKTLEKGANGRPVVDSAPLLEKAWAVEAGLGWQGRHSILINKKIGSFFFIGILILNIELDYDKPFTEEYCDDCRVCIDHCPTGAINENHTIDTRKCIANLTIENRGPIPEEILPEMGGRVYGCDRCQEVCPWNKDAKPHKNPEFNLSEEIGKMTKEDWVNLSRDQFKRLFKGSAIERKKYDPFMKNVTNVTKSGG
ncbi:MAG: tRNA epoxyqueuosine(34) reductase QueG [Bacteroidetes bacterium]|nr:MAG: tRNA epoxyqueuosine(34) reductase QueG [Bacteroidota bacterium]